MTAPNAAATEARTMRYQVIGMDCPDDIAAIEKTARAVAGIAEAHVSLASHAMTVRSAAGLAPLSELERAVSGLGFRLDRHEPRGDGGAAPLTSSHLAPGSKRTLWIVVTLNLGYGVVEMIGGFLMLVPLLFGWGCLKGARRQRRSRNHGVASASSYQSWRRLE